MNRWKKKTMAIILVAILMLTATGTPVFAQNDYMKPSFESMAMDLVVLRPLGLTATVLGCAFFVASLPFTVWSKKRIREAGKNYVVKPGSYTFVRELGDLND